MANEYQRRARRRKVIYVAGILVLFTTAIFYRRLVIEPRANDLQLREIARGEVDLSSSAVRLMLTGSRGVASTFLWATAIDRQKRHEWNEVELLVGSITKLQPYFLTPWLFQSWNLAFNVAVECDRPRDKYYYVSRGIELLGEGERRNQGMGDIPGHPELRHNVALYYMRKIGMSDEKTTMRCLYDLSSIDPLHRNPDWFATTDENRRQTINTKELAKFSQNHPRLVRRLREGLDYASDKQIVEFLEKNRDLPSRFFAPDWARLPKSPPEQRQSKLKDVREQFPIFPPTRTAGMADPSSQDLTPESNDVYLAARTWSEYASQPLPPPMFDDKSIKEFVQSNKKFRLPKAMALVIFRGYPARCQSYIAETLEEEGWFDDEGWVVRDWFDRDSAFADTEFRVGTEAKYHAQAAWERAANLYYEYGRANDLLLTPAALAELDEQAEPYRVRYKIAPGTQGELRSDDRATLKGAFTAHHRPIWSKQNRMMANYDAHFHTSHAERMREAVLARKFFHQAERLRRFEGSPEQALERYDRAWPLWLQVSLRNPQFAANASNQEDMYEYQLKHIRLEQSQRSNVLRPVAIATTGLAVWPHGAIEPLLTPSDKARILPIRNVRGILDWVQYVDLGDEPTPVRYWIAAWARGASGFPGLAPPPTVANETLVRYGMRHLPRQRGWIYLMEEDAVQRVRDRLGVNKSGS